MNHVTFANLRLLQLTLENVGPYRDGAQTLKFEGNVPLGNSLSSDDKAPANFFMLLAKNGYGKTTILETIFNMMSLLGATNHLIDDSFYFEAGARVQLDARVTLTIEDKVHTALLSVWYGSSDPVVSWTDDQVDELAQASVWARIGFERIGNTISIARGTDELGKLIHTEIGAGIGVPPTSLYGLSTTLPSVIFFPANRAIFAPNGPRAVLKPSQWGYQPALRFESDGPDWAASVDALLVWLEWLDDGRLADLLTYLNGAIFLEKEKAIRPPLREHLRSYVSTPEGEHSLYRLSHGERALLQFFARTLCHMTENTIIIIDEIEIHLHTKWLNKTFQAIKKLLRDVPSLSVIFTTHNRELIQLFNHNSPEAGLIKGGFLIDEGLS